MSKMLQWLALVVLGSSLGCADDAPKRTLTDGIFAPLGQAMPRASEEQKATFARGKKVVERRFTRETGLGPTFNLVSCGGCHERPVIGGSAGHYRDFLLVATRLTDGSYLPTGKNGVQTQYQTTDSPRSLDDPRTTISATRHPIPFFGTGLLAEISDAEILRRADPDDADGNGISGRPNYDRGFVGRFGRKAQTVSIEGFIRGPLFNHLGLTSNPLSPELKRMLPVPSAISETSASLMLRELVIGRARAQVAAPEMPNHDDDGVPDPELSEQDLFDLVSFSMLLAPPTPDAAPSPAALRGKQHFRKFGCDGCHVEDLEGPGGLVPAYSDLLLHDMGPELADGIMMGQSLGSEFRTQPLWGIVAVGPYMHDGRADTLDAAIRAHGGEGGAARDAYVAAGQSEHAELIAFLESLGGREIASPGLIAPGTPIAAQGEPGSPARPLSEPEQTRFLRGRALFDRDFGFSQGLGPTFNGDSCRACHFDPVPGGAGPSDVDVMRQAQQDGRDFGSDVAHGTMLHRHHVDGTRPPAAEQSGLFELRQTPTLLGLGLIDRIPDSALLALADPDDANGDGVSGRVRRLADGRLGRFGWKSNVPSLRDFTRDGLSNELGLTLPASDSPFGITHDDDGVADPEIDQAQIDDLLFYLDTLAAPARDAATPVAQLEAGEQLFAVAGCAACHVPSLTAGDGTRVPLYSDLLLHDVRSASYVGVVDGDAAPRELRTPPLWGLRATAPYLHDGSATTVEQAIAAHASEAESARRAYEQLPADARSALLTFLRSL
jgi:CxxC motif-containing protein (DUF1111 family)